MNEKPRILVIGVGNLHRGDDAVGRIVARRVSGEVPPEIQVVERDGGATEVMDAFAGADAVIIVDAVHSGGEPGRVHRFDAHVAPLPAQRTGDSTHGLGVAQAVELSRALGSLPPVVVVFGVEASAFDIGAGGEGLSTEVEAAVGTVADRVIEEVESVTGAWNDA